MLLSTFGLGLLLLGWFLLLLKAFALADAALRPDSAFRAAGKLNKTFWLLVLGVAVLWDAFVPFNVSDLIRIAGLIAAIVYIVDVRPAIRGLGRGRGRSGYGSW